MIPVISRIALRYVAAALVTYGVITSDIGEALGSDPDILVGVEIAAGALIAGAVEVWCCLARRWGWR
jgi:hypothetical protein